MKNNVIPILEPMHTNIINFFCARVYHFFRINIVLMNGCFYNGPVIWPRSVLMVEEVCNGPRQSRGPLQTSEAIITRNEDI